MLKLSKMNALSAVALAMAAAATPSLAAAGTYSSNASYENCKRSDTDNQILGGVIGAVTGGVFGSQVAGNGARSEGSALGAVIGAVAGSQIANKDCRSRSGYPAASPQGKVYQGSGYQSSGYQGSGHHGTVHQGSSYQTAPVYSSAPAPVYTQTAPVYSPAPAPVYTQTAPVYTSSAPVTTGGYTTVYTSPRVQPVQRVSHNSYSSHGDSYNRGYGRLNEIERQLAELRGQRDSLVARSRYEHSHRLDRRIERIGYKIADLKKQKRALKKRNKRGSHQGYNSGSRHYSGAKTYY